MKLPGRGEKGFTLVELLIVMAMLAVLATVVIMNVGVTFGRGAEQAYETDQKTIQQVVALFLFDPHVGPGSGWGEGRGGHYYPTADGRPAADDLASLLAAAGNNFPPVLDIGLKGTLQREQSGLTTHQS